MPAPVVERAAECTPRTPWGAEAPLEHWGNGDAESLQGPEVYNNGRSQRGTNGPSGGTAIITGADFQLV